MWEMFVYLLQALAMICISTRWPNTQCLMKHLGQLNTDDVALRINELCYVPIRRLLWSQPVVGCVVQDVEDSKTIHTLYLLNSALSALYCNLLAIFFQVMKRPEIWMCCVWEIVDVLFSSTSQSDVMWHDLPRCSFIRLSRLVEKWVQHFASSRDNPRHAIFAHGTQNESSTGIPLHFTRCSMYSQFLVLCPTLLSKIFLGCSI